MKTLYCLELVCSKNHFNSTKVFVLRQFKMTLNQIECWPDKRSGIKFLVAEMCKPCAICSIFDIYGKASFSQKNPYKWSKQSVGKKQSVVWKHSDSPLKGKVSSTVISKESHADCLLDTKRPITWQNLFIYWMTLRYIYIYACLIKW